MLTSMSHRELRSWKLSGEGFHSSRKESRNGSKNVAFDWLQWPVKLGGGYTYMNWCIERQKFIFR